MNQALSNRASELLNWLQEATNDLGKQFVCPDDDWSATLFCLSASGSLFVLPLRFSGDAEKKLCCAVTIPSAIAETKAVTVGLVLSTWVVRFTESDGVTALDERVERLMGGLRPSQHPRRHEELILTVFEENVSATATADIHRHSQCPPTLGEWARQPAAVQSRGQFYDAICAALKANDAPGTQGVSVLPPIREMTLLWERLND